MSNHRKKSSIQGNPAPMLNFVSDALNSKKLSVLQDKSSGRGAKSPKSYRLENKEAVKEMEQDYKQLQEKYGNITTAIHGLFIQVNSRYYDFNDINEKLNRKSNEFGYQRLEPVKLIDLIREMLDTYIQGILKTQEEVSNYKLITDEETQDYIWLLSKSERDMRQLIRDNQQLKLLITNLETKISSYEKQIELLTNYTQKAMEEMKQEFSYAIDLLAERESNLNILKDEIKRKNDIIRSLDEQLISVLILEHKIGYLNQKQSKEKQKIKQEFNSTLKHKEHDLKQTFELDQKQKEAKIEQMEQILKQMQIEKNVIERDLGCKLEFAHKKITLKDNQINQSIQKLHKLEDKLSDMNHAQFLSDKAQHKFTQK